MLQRRVRGAGQHPARFAGPNRRQADQPRDRAIHPHAGSSSEQEALDGVDGHGVFTEALLKGLQGGADQQDAGNHDGKVSIYELGEFTKAEVPKLAAQIAHGYNQKPRWYFNGDDMFDLRDAN